MSARNFFHTKDCGFIAPCIIETNEIMNIKQIGNLYPEAHFKNCHRGRIYSTEGLAPTQNTNTGGGNNTKVMLEAEKQGVKRIRIRKLIPNECFRLMGVKDDEFKQISQGISDSQLYKLAGNSIVVDVLEKLFENLFYPTKEDGCLF